jgi:hypothetical protein
MTLSIRFVPGVGRLALTANGRSYSVNGAATVDVPYGDALAIASDQARQLMVIGATADRPAYNPGAIGGGVPPMMYDTTVGGPIFYVFGTNPPQWINISGASV